MEVILYNPICKRKNRDTTRSPSESTKWAKWKFAKKQAVSTKPEQKLLTEPTLSRRETRVTE